MKNKELFNRTIKVWIRAFLDGTLAKANCYACAVGNLAAAGLGEKYVSNIGIDKLKGLATVDKDGYEGIASVWGSVFYTAQGIQVIKEFYLNSLSVEVCIKSTGYNYKDLMKIEYAFETNTKILDCAYCLSSEQEILEDQFNGLIACIDVLMEIHECTDESVKEEFKQALMVKL